MRFACKVHGHRRMLACGMLGLMFASAGCGGGTDSVSTVAPATPPPGRSAQELQEGYKKEFGKTGQPKVTKNAMKPHG